MPVLWKVAPACAEWLASEDNFLFASGILHDRSVVLELGCGISPLNGLALSRRGARCVLTDQTYVHKLIQRNISENKPAPNPTKHSVNASDYLQFRPLDWETDQVTAGLVGHPTLTSFDAVLACDCVFNYALIDPFVQTCVDACRLRADVPDARRGPAGSPCVCIVAQQLRSDDVFLSWLMRFCRDFHVWRLPEDLLPESLRPDAGFVMHVGVLRSGR